METVALLLVSRAAKLKQISLTCTMSLDSPKNTIEHIKKQWSVNHSSGIPMLLVAPQVCPTCQQPLLEAGGRSHQQHHNFVHQKTFEHEEMIEDAILALYGAQEEALEVASCKELECKVELVHAKASVVSLLTSDLHQQLTLLWNEKLLVLVLHQHHDEDMIRTKRQPRPSCSIAKSFFAFFFADFMLKRGRFFFRSSCWSALLVVLGREPLTHLD